MKKALNIIKNIIVILIVIGAVSMMIFTIISSFTFNRNDRNIMGYKAFIVLSDSMSATDFDAGDLVIIKEVADPSTLNEGDIIAYQSTNTENYGETVTHKIRSKATDASGNPGFITYGTTTNVDDEAVVLYDFVLGKYQFSLPKVGTFFNFLKTTPGYIICIFMPFFILILIQGTNTIRLFRRYKQEQMEELATEKGELEKARIESQQMMAELMKLKAELNQREKADSTAQQTESSED